MTTPEPVPHDAEEDVDVEPTVPPAATGYATPPPEGIPDAEHG